jgi:hypothetical protein
MRNGYEIPSTAWQLYWYSRKLVKYQPHKYIVYILYWVLRGPSESEDGEEYHSKLWDVGCNKCGIVVFSCGIPKSVGSINISPRPSPELPRGHLPQSHDIW